MPNLNVVNINDFDLAAWRQEQEANAASSPIAQVNLWFLESISHYQELVQKALVLTNKPGTCPMTMIFNKGQVTQTTVSLRVRVNQGVIESHAFLFPLFGEEERINVPVNNISAWLAGGEIQEIRDYFWGVVNHVPVNKNALANAINNANNLTEEDYTVESWLVLTDAVSAAIIVLEDEEATQAEVNQATQGINTAINALIPLTDKEALEDALTIANGLTETDYTPASWALLQNAVTSGISVFDNPQSSQVSIDNATVAINTAISNLVDRANFSDLTGIITVATQLTETDYTPNSWALLAPAILQAQSIADNLNNSQAIVDNATIELTGVIDNLVLRADKSALIAVITQFNELTETDYTPNSWTPLASAIPDAITLRDDLNATQESVDVTIGNLTTLIDNLSLRANTESLVAILNTADGLTEVEYTPNSWAVLTGEIEQASLILNNLNATQQQVDDATVLVSGAIGSLVERADKTALVDALDTASGLNPDIYTPSSWNAVVDAVTVGNTVMLDLNIDQETVDNTTTAITTAIDNLVLSEQTDFTALEDIIDDVDANFSEEMFTAETWSPLASAMDSGRDVLDNTESTQSQVNAAVSAINVAISNLVVKEEYIPVPFTAYMFTEASYRDMVMVDYPMEDVTDTTSVASVLAGEVANGPQIIDYSLEGFNDSSEEWESSSVAVPAIHGTLSHGIGVTEEPIEVTVSGLTNVEAIGVGFTVVINDETLRVNEVVNSETATFLLARGCVDTLPTDHSSGDSVFFYNADRIAVDNRETSVGDTVNLRLLSRTPYLTLDPSLANTGSVTLNGRQALPYPPGRLRFNGFSYPDNTSNGLVISWANRNRILQGSSLVDATAETVTPEAGVVTRVRLYDEGNLVREYNVPEGTSVAYTQEQALEDGPLQNIDVVVDSVKGGVSSMQQHQHSITRSGLGFRLGNRLGDAA